MENLFLFNESRFMHVKLDMESCVMRDYGSSHNGETLQRAQHPMFLHLLTEICRSHWIFFTIWKKWNNSFWKRSVLKKRWMLYTESTFLSAESEEKLLMSVCASHHMGYWHPLRGNHLPPSLLLIKHLAENSQSFSFSNLLFQCCDITLW